MSPDDIELLRLVREWQPPATLHPIAMQAWQLYEDGGMALSNAALDKLRSILSSHGGDLRPLGDALEGLTRFSILLTDRQQDAASAEKIVSLMRECTPLFEPFFTRVARALDNVSAADLTDASSR